MEPHPDADSSYVPVPDLLQDMSTCPYFIHHTELIDYICSYHGQSGSPVWLYNTSSGDRYIRGILSSSGDGTNSDAAGPGAFTLISEVSSCIENLHHILCSMTGLATLLCNPI